jgi:hypothetical protein
MALPMAPSRLGSFPWMRNTRVLWSAPVYDTTGPVHGVWRSRCRTADAARHPGSCGGPPHSAGRRTRCGDRDGGGDTSGMRCRGCLDSCPTAMVARLDSRATGIVRSSIRAVCTTADLGGRNSAGANSGSSGMGVARQSEEGRIAPTEGASRGRALRCAIRPCRHDTAVAQFPAVRSSHGSG